MSECVDLLVEVCSRMGQSNERLTQKLANFCKLPLRKWASTGKSELVSGGKQLAASFALTLLSLSYRAQISSGSLSPKKERESERANRPKVATQGIAPSPSADGNRRERGIARSPP